MTINVTTPDGGNVSFPEGTDAATITSVMEQHFGGGKNAQGAVPADGADTAITPNKLVRSAASGIPVLGGLANKANAAINAGLAPVLNPLFAEKDQLKGGSFGERYSKSLEEQNAMDETFHAAHPVVDTAAQVAGGIAATLPVAGTALGARALGLTGRTLPAQIAQGAASGAGINAADAAVRGQDPLAAAMVGGGIGAAAPAVARGVGALAQPIVNTARGIVDPAAEAARRASVAIDRDLAAGGGGLTAPEFAQATASGAPVNLMDIGGETTRALARSAANTSPEGRAVLNRAIDDRFAGQSQRLSDWLANATNFPNVEAQQAALAAEARAINGPAYRGAQQAAEERFPGGMWSPELERLSSSPDVLDAMREAAQRGAGRAVAEGFGSFNPGVSFENGMMRFGRAPSGAMQYPSMQFWDYAYRNLRDAADTAFRGGRSDLGNSLRTQATQMRTELDRMVPEFGQARAGAAHFFGADNALEAGRTFANRNFDLRGARAALEQMTPSQRQLFQDGFADQYIQNIRKMPDRASALNRIASSPAAREQLQIGIGRERANQLEAMLRVERIMDQARGAVQGNSTTARQLTELGLAGGAGSVLSGGGNPFSDPQALLNSMLVLGAMKGARGGLNAIDHRVAGEVARLLTSNNPAQLRLGMNMLGRNQRLLGNLRNADTALARAAAVQTTPGNQDQTRQQ